MSALPTMTQHCVSSVVLLFVLLLPGVLSSPPNGEGTLERELGRLFYNFKYDAGDSSYSFQNPLRPLREPCVVTLTEVLTSSGNETPPELGCILQGWDVVGEFNDYEIRVDGLNSSFVEQHDLLSFESTLFAEGAVVDDLEKMVFMPWGTEIKVGKVEAHNRRLTSATGAKHVLVLRVQGSDTSNQVTRTEANISASIFGTSEGLHTPKSQMKACSYDQLEILKASDNMPTAIKDVVGDDSVYTVTIGLDISAQNNMNNVVNAATDAFHDAFGVSLNSLAANPSNPDDLLVVYCIPPSTSYVDPDLGNNWLGFANRNGWKSWYRDVECTSLSILMHEFGHNLGLAHSGETVYCDYEYGDYVGYMGEAVSATSYHGANAPRKCFNAPKTYQLNWFSDRHVDIDCQNTAVSWQGNIIGFVDRDSNGVQVDDMMIIRLQNLDGDDVYVNFNRAVGFNIDSDDLFFETVDLVTITTRKAGLDYQDSSWVAALGQGESYSAYPGLTIKVDEISVFSTPMRASISIVHRPQQNQWVCTDAPKFGAFVQ